MSKKKTKPFYDSPLYVCKYCRRDRGKNHFSKKNMYKGIFICDDCIDTIYQQTALKYGKDRAILILCYLTDTPFIVECLRQLTVTDDFGKYVRKLNLSQFQKNGFKTFADSLLALSIAFQTEPSDRLTAETLTECVDEIQHAIKKLTEVRNSFKK